jgi:2'-5' RNA ligase
MRNSPAPPNGDVWRRSSAARGCEAPLRVFFALWPDAEARDALAALSRTIAARAGGRAPAVENLHLTLAFVGEIAPDRVAALVTAGREAADGVVAFEFALDRVGAFRGNRIVWAGASSVPAELDRLARRLGEALVAQGFLADPRPFQAHVTLARRCRRAVDAPLAVPVVWRVARFVLNASELASGGSRYRELDGWTLGSASVGDRRA